jgi:hypothetical protein
MYFEEIEKHKMPVNNVLEDASTQMIPCKFCGALPVVRYGFTEKHRQRHLCVKCNRTFINDAAPERRRYQTDVIASALDRFYEGRSLNEIKRQLDADFGVIPDPSSIYDWIFHYTQKAIDVFGTLKPPTGNAWLVNETAMKLKSGNSHNLMIIDCIEKKSHFLLASILSQIIFENAVIGLNTIYPRNSNGTELNNQILDQINRCTGKYSQLAARDESEDLTTTRYSPAETRLIRRLFSNRSKILRSLTNFDSACQVMSGWSIHYNFFQPNPALLGITPAQATGVEAPAKGWTDIIALNNTPNYSARCQEFKPG